MTRIKVNGVIISNELQWIYDAMGIDATSPNKVIEVLEANPGKDITLEINSPGGSVFSGSEIYTALRQHTGKVIGEITALAASAATVIMCGCNKVYASPTAQIMVHNVSSVARGNHSDMSHMAGVLKGADKTIANAYVLKTGKPIEEFLELMAVETWFDPQTALELGLIDGIMFTDDKERIEAKERFERLQGKESGSTQAASLENAKAKFRFLELSKDI